MKPILPAVGWWRNGGSKVFRMRIYDISLPLDGSVAVWPGDEPFRYALNWRIAEGAAVNLGSVSSSVHAGTHADAPVHFVEGGVSIGEVEISAYLGPAIVIDVSGREKIEVADVAVEGLESTPRLLLRTGAWSDPRQFPTRFPVIAPDVPAFLANRGIVLLGVDVPSVDEFESKGLPNHRALNGYGIRILESLCLTAVPEGRYELIALPLKIHGADGSPVRAILRSIEIN